MVHCMYNVNTIRNIIPAKELCLGLTERHRLQPVTLFFYLNPRVAARASTLDDRRAEQSVTQEVLTVTIPRQIA